MAHLILTKGMKTVVDDESFSEISKSKWSASWSGRVWYAKNNKGYLHRLIANAPAGLCVDHINGDTLDNRRKNLRICSHQQNTFNGPSRKPSSGFKGVSRFKNKWWARLTVNGKTINKGSFDSVIDAARAYDDLARRFHGEFARTNFE